MTAPLQLENLLLPGIPISSEIERTMGFVVLLNNGYSWTNWMIELRYPINKVYVFFLCRECGGKCHPTVSGMLAKLSLWEFYFSPLDVSCPFLVSPSVITHKIRPCKYSSYFYLKLSSVKNERERERIKNKNILNKMSFLFSQYYISKVILQEIQHLITFHTVEWTWLQRTWEPCVFVLRSSSLV